jgi:sugar lactone lactonase YvrE
MESTPELVCDVVAELGEGPLWDWRENCLWWVDILGRALHRFDPATGRDDLFDVGQAVGTVVVRGSGGVVLACADGFRAFDPRTGVIQDLGDPESDIPGNRFNDGKCDPRGRLWAGTMSTGEESGRGSLYTLEPAIGIRRRLERVTVSNGIAWTADESTMYFIDSPTRRIDAFDYDAATGEISNRRPAVEVPPELGFPDGMAIDAAGMLWVGMWGGWHVVTFDPRTGREVSRLRLPAANVTACAFGGDDLRDLYVTTARVGVAPDELRDQPAAGGLFRVRVDAPGVRSAMYAG